MKPKDLVQLDSTLIRDDNYRYPGLTTGRTYEVLEIAKKWGSDKPVIKIRDDERVAMWIDSIYFKMAEGNFINGDKLGPAKPDSIQYLDNGCLSANFVSQDKQTSVKIFYDIDMNIYKIEK